MIGLDTIGLLLMVATIGLGWWSAIGARTRARNAACRACRQAGVTFIDELAFRCLRAGRDASGRLCLKRQYHFEFIVRGDLRYRGIVLVEAQRVASVDLEPHPFDSWPPSNNP